MRLTPADRPETSPHDLTARAFAALDRRLLADSPAPIAVAVSGGGDSMALLALAADWGRRRNRPVLALSVDHGLQPASAKWSRKAARTAAQLGADARILAWRGEKPASGLSAAARQARHALLAEAAREAGAHVVLTGHTADDVAEAAVMREAGSTLGSLREWSPSPAWPEGRGLFLLRPLLAERRGALRAWLADRGLDWIDDPANLDPKYARSRARAALAGALVPSRPAAEAGPAMAILFAETREAAGGLAIDRETLRAADPETARRFLSAALLCAAGTARPPRTTRLSALLDRLQGEGQVAATLAGAAVHADPDQILVTREMPRGGLPPLEIPRRGVSVWDGRFEIEAPDRDIRIVPAAGRMARLGPGDRKEILGISPRLRGVQPLISPEAGTDGPPRPVLASTVARVSPLARSRLRAACGLTTHEADIDEGRVAPGLRASYVGIERPIAAAGL